MSASNIQWGKLIAGAAVAAGAVAAFAFFAVDLQDTVVPALKDAMVAAGDAIATGWNWIGENIIGTAHVAAQDATKTVQINYDTGLVNTLAEQASLAGEAGSGITGFITKNTALAAGMAAAVGGLFAAKLGGGGHAPVPQKSYAVAEELKQMEARMHGCMAKNGCSGMACGHHR